MNSRTKVEVKQNEDRTASFRTNIGIDKNIDVQSRVELEVCVQLLGNRSEVGDLAIVYSYRQKYAVVRVGGKYMLHLYDQANLKRSWCNVTYTYVALLPTWTPEPATYSRTIQKLLFVL